MLRRDFIRSMAAIGLWPFAKDIAPSPTPRIAWPAADDPKIWRWVRGQLDIPRDESYFNTGTLGAVPRPIVDTVAAHARDRRSPHHVEARHRPASRTYRGARAREKHLRPCRRRAGDRPETYRCEDDRLRCVHDEPAQMAAGAAGKRIVVCQRGTSE